MLKAYLMIIAAGCLSKNFGEGLVLMGFFMMLFMFCLSESSCVKMSAMFELDGLGWALICLSLWVISLGFMSSMKIKNMGLGSKSFILVNYMMLLALVFTFSVSDVLMFYIGFECCLIPVVGLILGWGYQPERVQAGMYLVFYTLLGSFPLFMLILMLMNKKGLGYMYLMTTSFSGNSIIFMILSGAFLVKMPMYSVHLWLLKAHVEAPVAGSMILAGVLLKLGGYGLMRILPMWSSGVLKLSEILLVFSVCGGVLIGLVCLRQIDLKLLIASSSVVHMSMCIAGLLMMSEWGYEGTLVMMVGHGLCSSGLFYLSNMVYERTHSRSLLINKGLLGVMPLATLWWALMCTVNLASPPSINLLSEILLISSLVGWSGYLSLAVGLLSFVSASYSLYMYALSQHGKAIISGGENFSSNILDFMISVLHWGPVNLMILMWGLFVI